MEDYDYDYAPEWQKILDEAPIDVDIDDDPSEIAATLRPRLAALMQLHDAEPTAEGWRKLALALATENFPATTLKQSGLEQRGRPGRPSIMGHGALYMELLGTRRKIESHLKREPTDVETGKAYLQSKNVRRGGSSLPSLKTLQAVMTAGDAGHLRRKHPFAFVQFLDIKKAAVQEAAAWIEKEFEISKSTP